MDQEITALRKDLIDNILAKQDEAFRWGYDEEDHRIHPDYLHYTPKYKATLWTLLLLADLKTPADLPQVRPAMQLVTEQFYAPEHGIFRIPGMSHFPIPCLNGNMIYLHHYFQTDQTAMLNDIITFFDQYQRFDDGGYKTARAYPYLGNISCYGSHTCYWGVIKLLKGISFIPRTERTKEAQHLIENCIEFVLHHEVCFSSHRRDELLHRDIDKLAFPNSWKSDFLEILWLLAREEVRDSRTARALDLLRAKQKDGEWELEKPFAFIVSTGAKNRSNAFISERASEVLGVYGH